MGGKQSTATSTTTNQPWSAQEPYLKGAMGEALKLYNSSGPQYFNGSTVAGFSKPQKQAQAMGMQRAMNGSSQMRGANQFNSDVLAGKYMQDPNQDAVFQGIQQKVMPAVNGQFMSSGRYGSQMQGDTMARALTEAYSPYASQNWQAGMDRRMQAAQFAPELAQADYNDINAMYDIGTQQQQLAQSEIDDAKNRWDFYQDLPANKLGQLMGFIGGNYGGTTTSAQPYYKPGLGSQLLGGGLSLLSML